MISALRRLGSALTRNPVVEAYRSEPPDSALSALPLARLVQPAALVAAGLADAKPNAPPNAKVGEASVVKSGCESDRYPDGPRRGAARDHDAALGAGSERQGPRREASGSGERSGSGRRPDPRARPRPHRGSPYCTWRNRVEAPLRAKMVRKAISEAMRKGSG